MPVVLIVDDDADMREALAEAAEGFGFEARLAAGGGAALALLEAEEVDAVILDLRMPGIDGIETLRRIRARGPDPPVVVLTAHATAENTIEAMRLGAYDHITKPISAADLGRVLGSMTKAAGASAATSEPDAPAGAIVGASEPIRAVQKAIGRLADSDATVLLTGETGTGKELVARALHSHGRRARMPFVAVNCAAIPPELIESELFGHVRGAFTGASADRAGAFRDASGGTLLLDEVGDMLPATQAKILRALESRVITPIGGRPAPVDVRVIAATHRDLARAAAQGAFRQDLYYRLNVAPLHLPPLRARRSDIALLARHFLKGKRLSHAAIARLESYAWPGNVRELRNAMDRVAALAAADPVDAADFAFLEARDGSAEVQFEWPEETLPAAVERLEATLIRRALQGSDGNRAEAARRLGIHRQLLYAKLRRYGLDVSEERTPNVAQADEASDI